jgi:hypothetical protein
MRYHSALHCPTEWQFISARRYDDPFNEVELDVLVVDPEGTELCVPAFWAGGSSWRVRFAGRKLGTHRWRTVCSDTTNSSLHGIEGELEVTPYDGDNTLLRHGPLKVASSGRYLEHLDGTPFFWLGDTWWMGLCKRLSWPGDFQLLTQDRVAKGFSVIQIVAGLYPDMGAYDERGVNEAGFPWEPNWARINPAYFDMADLRIHWLVQAGLVPCIVGCWGYYIHWLGVEKMKQHWRNLVARYGAYPVIWCMAGEVLMPWYLERPATSQAQEELEARTRNAWNEVTAYVRAIDPYHHPVTAHPSTSARDHLADDLLDFDMLQTGHGDRTSLPNTVRSVVASYAREPVKPVVNGEVCYEGIGEASRQEVQRLMFWVCMLSGAAGFTYGANGIWQVNRPGKPFGPSPHGTSWGNTPWQEAYQLPGSGQLGLAKKLLQGYKWWEFEPHPEWVEPHWSENNYMAPYAAGIPRQVRIIFVPGAFIRVQQIRHLEPDVTYQASYINPADGAEQVIGPVKADPAGTWAPPPPPIFQDWLLVLEAPDARVGA